MVNDLTVRQSRIIIEIDDENGKWFNCAWIEIYRWDKGWLVWDICLIKSDQE